MYALIRQWESSGLTQEQFSHKRGIAKSTFGYWRKKYLKETSSSKSKKNFIPVKIAKAGDAEIGTGELALFYPNGVRLVCSGSMDLTRLKPLIVL